MFWLHFQLMFIPLHIGGEGAEGFLGVDIPRGGLVSDEKNSALPLFFYDWDWDRFVLTIMQKAQKMTIIKYHHLILHERPQCTTSKHPLSFKFSKK
jgi:hypothetical protein